MIDLPGECQRCNSRAVYAGGWGPDDIRLCMEHLHELLEEEMYEPEKDYPT